MVRITCLQKSYGGQSLFSDVSFNINPGEKVGLVGRNGHGKTTLFRIMLGMEEADAGDIIMPNGYRIGHLDQHIRLSAATVLDEGCLGLPKERREERWKVEKILSGLGFSAEDCLRPPQEFSGGFQVRLSLAKALVSEPDLLLLDEPTNYLDISSIIWLTGFLKSWKGELLLVTHDRGFMDGIVTHTVALHRQQARKVAGGTDRIYEQIALEEEIYEKTRLNDAKRRREVELFISRFRAKARLGGLVQSRVKMLARQEAKGSLERIENLELSFNHLPFPARTMLTGTDMTFGYSPDEAPLIDSFSLAIARQDRIAIIGKNGKGKSTLLKMLAGEAELWSGDIKQHHSLRIGYFGQTNVELLNPNRTVVEEITSAAPDCTMQQARDIAGSLMFEGDAALKRISVLSGGEKSRVLLGRILASPCNMLLLDEPTNHLDMDSCDALMAALDAFPGAVVIVTHNETFLHTLAQRLVVFDRGGISLFEGSYGSFLQEVGWEKNEDAAAREKQAAAARISPSGDRKALRKEKAEIIQRRSEVLRPLEAEIADLERLINEAETETAANNEALVRASMEGNAADITRLSMRNKEIEGLLEESYIRLWSLHEDMERASQKFDGLLNRVVLLG